MRKESLDRVRGGLPILLLELAPTTSRFYERLFSVDPSLRAMFTIDMDLQRQHFAAAMAIIVRNLSMMDVLSGPLRELGASHASIGVAPRHYPVVRDAMLFAMAQTLGDAWSAELAEGWREILDAISGMMLEGAAQSLTRASAPPPVA